MVSDSAVVPCSSIITGVASTVSAASVVRWATPYRRPKTWAATRQSANQPKFRNGESRSEPTAIMPSAWNSSDPAG